MKRSIIKPLLMLLGFCFTDVSMASNEEVILKMYPAYGGRAHCLSNLACTVVLTPATINGDAEDVVITNHSATQAAKHIIVVQAPPENTTPVSGTLPAPFTETFVVYDPRLLSPEPPVLPCYLWPESTLPAGKSCSLRFSATQNADNVPDFQRLTIQGDNTQAIDVFVKVDNVPM